MATLDTVKRLVDQSEQRRDSPSKRRERKEALEAVIALAGSSSPADRKYVVESIPKLLIDLPELEEPSIHAVYDICEDPSSEVRIQAYKGLVEISRVCPGLLKQNVDVLLQLLQSDDLDELNHVHVALTKHLMLNPTETLALICNQLAPINDPNMDKEEVQLRDRMRSLVISYMVSRAGGTIITLSKHRPECQPLLVNEVAKALPTLSYHNTNLLITNILTKLEIYHSEIPDPSMKRLMQALMDKAKTMMDSKSDFSDVISYLQLANQIHPAAGPTPLLRFYLFSFGKEATLRRLAQPQLVWVAKEFAKIHMACGLRKDLDQVQTTAIRKQVIQWSWLLLEVLYQEYLKLGGKDQRPILEAFDQWIMVYHDATVGEKWDPQTSEPHMRMLKSLIPVLATEKLGAPGESLKYLQLILPKDVPLPRPATTGSTAANASELTRVRPHGTSRLLGPNVVLVDQPLSCKRTLQAANADSSSNRPPKRTKPNGEITPSATLLSRLNAPSSSASQDMTEKKVYDDVKGSSAVIVKALPPSLAIKGAAKQVQRQAVLSHAQRASQGRSTNSLLERIK